MAFPSAPIPLPITHALINHPSELSVTFVSTWHIHMYTSYVSVITIVSVSTNKPLLTSQILHLTHYYTYARVGTDKYSDNMSAHAWGWPCFCNTTIKLPMRVLKYNIFDISPIVQTVRHIVHDLETNSLITTTVPTQHNISSRVIDRVQCQIDSNSFQCEQPRTTLISSSCSPRTKEHSLLTIMPLYLNAAPMTIPM